MAPTTSVSRCSAPATTTFAPHATSASLPAAEGLQREAQAQLALNELFPHLRVASDAALRDIFVSLRVPARLRAAA